MSNEVRFTVTGLAALVADDWRIGSENIQVGEVHLLCIDPKESELAANDHYICEHNPYFIYPEVDQGVHYIAGMDGFAGRESLQSVIDPSDPERVLGLWSLRGKSITFEWLSDLEEKPIGSDGQVAKQKSFDDVLRIADHLNSSARHPSSARLVDSYWKDETKVEGLVSSRVRLDRGNLSASTSLGHAVIVLESTTSEAIVRFAQNIFWKVGLGSEGEDGGIKFLKVKARTVDGATEELVFQLAGPNHRPDFAIVNLCGTEFPPAKEGTEVAAYLDLSPPLARVAVGRRPILRVPPGVQPVRSGSDFCTPNASTWSGA